MKQKGWLLILAMAMGLVWIITATAQPPATLMVYYYRDGQAVPVERSGVLRGDPQADAEALLVALLAGPTAEEQASGLISPLPAGAQLAAVAVSGAEVTVDLRLPPDLMQNELDAYRCDAIVEQVVKTLHPLGLHHVHVRAEDPAGTYQPISAFLPRIEIPVPAVPPNDDPAPDHPGAPTLPSQGRPVGTLSGKTVWLSAGHGWYWSDTLGRWTTQRGNNYGLVEDFSNAEAVNYYLARYLWNAGADVWLVRERAMNEHEIIVDNDDGAPAYVETGAWTTSGSTGYNGGTYRYAMTAASASATATWTPDLPTAGLYAVWAWFRHGANRPADAYYQVSHAGGVTTVRLSQEVHGETWYYLGEYYFQAGAAGHVTLLNESDDASQAVIADAIRFGGGLGSIPEPGGTSGEPRWEEAAKYWAHYQGTPPEVYASDVTARPLYAEWETAKGYPGEAENSAFISWHTNAGGGTGTESYVHDTEPTPGSLELQDAVHAELIYDLRHAWDPAWVNRGQKSADFGELRELSTLPGILLEIAFHDTEDPGDANDLREPHFRQIAARAVYQGIVEYFAGRDGVAAYLVPEPPQRLAARTSGLGQVTLTWAPPPCCDGVVGDAATGYKVYHSTTGRAFDEGVETVSPTLTLAGLLPGSLHFFRVTALNDGGESLPTPVVAVRTPTDGGTPPLLIVDGFDRLDAASLVRQWESPFLGTARRMFLERMNRYNYAVEHGEALAACGGSTQLTTSLAFDGAVNEAVVSGTVSLAEYAAVDWFVGEDSVADQSLSDAERALLAAYLDGGGRLLLSGAEIGCDLVENGRDPTFYTDYLRATYLGDDADTYDLAGTPDGMFAGLSGGFDDGSGPTYHVDYPDRLAASGGSTVALSYLGGTGDGAALAYAGDYRLVYAGFPLETVTDPLTRTALFCAAAEYLLPAAPVESVCTPRLINPGFEGGLGQSAWQMDSSVLAYRDALPPGIEPYTGDWLAWFQPTLSGTAALTQVVGLPTGEPTATLSLAWLIDTDWPNSEDRASLGVYNLGGALQTTLLTITGESLTNTWFVSELDVSEFSGETVQIAVRATSSTTHFFVDDVSLTTCGPSGPDEFRGLWVDAYHDGIKTPQQIDELIETALAGNFNALVVQVRRRGDTYYPSALDPWAPDADPGFDALTTLIDHAHAVGLEVHAWATALAIWNGNIPPADPTHTLLHHGPGATSRDYWLMTSYSGEEQAGSELYYLDPGHPDVVDYTVAVYAELAAHYDLDGLHLDRIRYPEQQGTYCQGQAWYCQDWGYNPTAVARFQAQTGRSDIPDPLDEAWLQWRREQVTALVRRIYLTVTALNPRLRVSAALSTVGFAPTSAYGWETRSPYRQQLQDWRGWLEEGILDLGLPMTYLDQDDDAAQFDAWIEWEKDHQYGRGVVVGTGLYRNDVADSLVQWQHVRQPSTLGNKGLGLCGYSYATPSDDGTSRRAFVNAAASQVLTQPVATPPLPWKDGAPAFGHLMGTLTQTQPCANLDGLPLTLTGPQTRTLVSDGSGWFGVVDLPPGQYVLSTNPVTPALVIHIPVTISAGTVTEQIVALPNCLFAQRIYLPLITK